MRRSYGLRIGLRRSCDLRVGEKLWTWGWKETVVGENLWSKDWVGKELESLGCGGFVALRSLC